MFSTMYPTLFYHERVKLIQIVRLLHALTESDFSLDLLESELPKFDLLHTKFSMPLNTGAAKGFDIAPYLRFSHPEPFTSIGDLQRTLIFPHAVTDYCRQLWKPSRSQRFTFDGLITPQRREVLTAWAENELGLKKVELPDGNSFTARLMKRLGLADHQRKKLGDLSVWFSRKGRKYPEKAWDEDYCRILADSQFVLCPNGDYTWSYRFFESILCGAIPIVEDDCRAYNGFHYHHFNEDPTRINWDEADAEHNLNLCLERITIPLEELTTELKRITRS